jgi:hypothetical protein
VQGSKSVLFASGLALCALCSLSHTARAQQSLFVGQLGGAELKVDGQLGEWRGVRFKSLGESDDCSVEYAFGYDARALYVGARVHDDEFVRSARPSPREDALVLTLLMPRASGRAQPIEVWLFAGVPGKQAAVAALALGGAQPERTPGVTLVEGPLPGGADGYVLEASVPWSVLPGADEFPLARGALRLHDVDGEAGSRAHELASARSERGAELPPVLFEGGPNAAIDDFLRAKSLGRENVRYDLLGDVMGDARLERVVVAGTNAVAAGPEIEGGLGFHYQELPVAMSTGVRAAELRDLNADGKAELLLRLRLENDPDARELPYVLDWTAGRPRRATELEEQIIKTEAPPPSARAAQPAPARQAEQAREPEPERVVHQQPPGAAALIAAFRKDRAIDPALKPRFVQHANVAEDARIESLLLFGKDVLVIGKGYRGGSGYFYYSLPVSDAADVQRMFTGDVTGDGRRELFVRFKQRIDDVQREILIAYSFNDEGAQPIAAIEVRRAQGEASVGNVVALVPDAGHWALRITAGNAHGWNARSYPFVSESIDDYAPLLLPWKDGATRYRYDGDRLVPSAERPR